MNRGVTFGPSCNNSGISANSELWVYDLCPEDATWILMAAFIIFTMQTGFGMLESGCVSLKNEANIMMKNFADVVFGGLTYWIFGFSMSFGTDPGSSPILGIGDYGVDSDYNLMGPVFAAFLFQLSFATTATTIVSGAMAERCNFKAYCIFSMFNTIIFCVPARWLWDEKGFLMNLGVIDVAGAGGVHLLGGVSGFFGAWMLGPRMGRYDNGRDPIALGSPLNSLVGLFVLWWGWLAFNSGSTYGVQLNKWKFAVRAAVNTMIASIGGGVAGAGYALVKSRPGTSNYFEVSDLVNSILGALVASTAGCTVYHTLEAFITGFIGGGLVLAVSSFADRMGVDDPVGATAVHGFGGLWGMMAVGFFTEDDRGELGVTNGHSGVFRGGTTHLLQVQLFACVCILAWAGLTTCLLLWIINRVIPIRLSAEDEILGSDFVEHAIRRDRISGEVLGPKKKITQENLTTVSVIPEVTNKPCRLISFRKSLGDFNRWRKIRMKALAASIFSGGLRRKRNMAASVAGATAITCEENKEYIFRMSGKYFPRPIFITEDFYGGQNGLENTGDGAFEKNISSNSEELIRLRHQNKF